MACDTSDDGGKLYFRPFFVVDRGGKPTVYSSKTGTLKGTLQAATVAIVAMRPPVFYFVCDRPMTAETHSDCVLVLCLTSKPDVTARLLPYLRGDKKVYWLAGAETLPGDGSYGDCVDKLIKAYSMPLPDRFTRGGRSAEEAQRRAAMDVEEFLADKGFDRVPLPAV